MNYRHAIAAGLFCVMTSSASAALIVADPDAFLAGTDISSAFAGVSLSAVGGGFGAGTGIFSVNPSTKTEPFTASTGTLSFGTSSTSFPHLFREPEYLLMRAGFAAPTNFVSLDFIGNDLDGDVGLLRVYDAGDTLLASLTTGSLTTSQFATLSFTSGSTNIAYILASGESGASSIGIDNLRFNGVPEPGTLAILGLGFAGLAATRRRKQ